MPPTFGNLFSGLSNGPVDSESSSVINAIVGDAILLIGETVRLVNAIDILPRVGIVTLTGAVAYGVIVGGDKKGIYQNGEEGNSVSENLEKGIVAGLMGESVRVCTQGRCLAEVISRKGNVMNVGTPLTPDVGVAPINNFGTLTEAESGNFVLARLLQEIPSGDMDNPKIRIAAVDVHREGKLP